MTPTMIHGIVDLLVHVPAAEERPADDDEVRDRQDQPEEHRQPVAPLRVRLATG